MIKTLGQVSKQFVNIVLDSVSENFTVAPKFGDPDWAAYIAAKRLEREEVKNKAQKELNAQRHKRYLSWRLRKRARVIGRKLRLPGSVVQRPPRKRSYRSPGVDA